LLRERERCRGETKDLVVGNDAIGKSAGFRDEVEEGVAVVRFTTGPPNCWTGGRDTAPQDHSDARSASGARVGQS
jgi:hypothetical protein